MYHVIQTVDMAYVIDNYLPSLTWTQARELFGNPRCIGLFPIGAVEAHGPHLPLFTDVLISLELCQRIRAALVGETVVILPQWTWSVTDYAGGFAGSIGISRDTAACLLDDILNSFGRHGLSTVALVNSHLEPEHIAVLEQVAAIPRERPRVLFINHCRKPWALQLSDEFKSGDCHAGSYETSLMLASRYANLVDVEQAHRLPAANHQLVAKMKSGVRTFEAMGATQAYFGNPAAATREEGERMYEVLTRMWVDMIRGGGG